MKQKKKEKSKTFINLRFALEFGTKNDKIHNNE